MLPLYYRYLFRIQGFHTSASAQSRNSLLYPPSYHSSPLLLGTIVKESLLIKSIKNDSILSLFPLSYLNIVLWLTVGCRTCCQRFQYIIAKRSIWVLTLVRILMFIYYPNLSVFIQEVYDHIIIFQTYVLFKMISSFSYRMLGKIVQSLYLYQRYISR